MADDTLRLSADAQKNLVDLCKSVLETHGKDSELNNKFEFIDIAYARYKQLEQSGQDGVSILGDELDQAGLNFDEINIPIVVSHVDSYVGYFADVFLSGYPMFPVVSTPETRQEAEALQAIIDTHAKQGRYARQMLMSFYDAAKYNLSALEVDWAPLEDFAVLSAYDAIKNKNSPIKSTAGTYYNRVKRIDPYNSIKDAKVLPADIPYCGDYTGYIELVSAVELKRRLIQMSRTGFGYNATQSMSLKLTNSSPGVTGSYYKQAPQVSSILSSSRYRRGTYFDWDAYLTDRRTGLRQYANCYEFTTIYARIIPDMLKMSVPAKGTPQVWKLCFVNHEKLVYAARQFNVYDTLPIYFGQPIEDGLGYQTQSVAENAIPFQEGSSKLFSIRLNSARRAVMDRALYDPSIISPSHLNSAHVAPKIPVKDNSLINGKTMDSAYKQIPFDSRGTETVVQDLGMMMGLGDKLNGINQPLQGQFQKGNKTRKEWDDTMEGATNRLRLRGLSLEMQQFLPIKEQIKFNVYQHNLTGDFQSQSNGTSYKIDAAMLQRIKERIGNFELADGYSPAAKLASTDVLVQGMQVIMNSPILQQTWGAGLPSMFAHMMSLGGVKGLDQYLPKQPEGQPVQQAQPPQQVPPEAQQGPVQ